LQASLAVTHAAELEYKIASAAASLASNAEVGLCRLNQVDPWPITYSLSNP
jgi:hypothetical protein